LHRAARSGRRCRGVFRAGRAVRNHDPRGREAFDACLALLLVDDTALLIVAESDGGVKGYCLGFDHPTLFAGGRVAWVEEIMVAAESRRRWVGARLMEAVEDWARGRGGKLVTLATRRAAPFMPRCGMTGRRRISGICCDIPRNRDARQYNN
jgi:GNAT superfamily N-acetyltransferase